jgi:hypothetical protein
MENGTLIKRRGWSTIRSSMSALPSPSPIGTPSPLMPSGEIAGPGMLVEPADGVVYQWSTRGTNREHSRLKA